MSAFSRLAIYAAPRSGPFASLAADWLGRCAESGAPRAQPVLPGVADPWAITTEPRRYGFHATLRAPFRPSVSLEDVIATVDRLAARLAPTEAEGLAVSLLHGFLALTPVGRADALSALAAEVVRGTDPLRAPLTETEVARRRPESLSARQRALLARWGYPFVMEEFRFHFTLTDRLAPEETGAAEAALRAYFAPALPRPFRVEDLCLFAETGDKSFRLIHRAPLSA